MITAEQLKGLLPTNRSTNDWLDLINEMLPRYNINTPQRIAGFFAQTGHESNDYKTLEENLNYRADSLERVFSKYFSRAGRNAAEYAGQPEAIANIVYANRLGNGDTASGDGYFFRGGGPIQLTGRANYTDFGATLGMTAEEAAEYVRTKRGALESACWYWKTRNLNVACDRQDIVGMSKIVNGGTIGLKDRMERWEKNLRILNGATPINRINTEVYKMGSSGEIVRKIQTFLGINADGKFGPGTVQAVKIWQTRKGLKADGIVGPVTLAQMGIKT